MRRTISLSALLLLITSLYYPAIAQKKKISFEQAFRGVSTGISKPLPVIKGWIDDEHYLEYRKDDNKGEPRLMSVAVKTGKAVLYTENAKPDNIPSAASLGLDSVKNLTASPDGKWVAYTKDNNLFAMELQSKKEVQLTNDGSDVILNGYASWVYYEEILGRRSRYRAFWWSPDSRHIAYMRFDDTRVPIFPIYVPDGQHGYLEKERYPKAGDPNPEVKIGITSVDNPQTIWADFNEKDDQYFGMPLWTPGGKLWISWMNRDQNNLKIYQVDIQKGSKKEIYDEKQKTWIDLDDNERIHFLENGNEFIFKSDKDGWENLYLYDMDGKPVDQITTGNFWGTDILKIDEKEKMVYLRARKENSARYDLYRVGLDGKGLTRMSFGDYSHDMINISPKGKYFITVYSNLSTPPVMALVNSKGKIIRELGNSRGDNFASYEIPRTALYRVKSDDGLFELPVTVTYPLDFDSTKRYPVLISIYGGPNAGTVYDRWRYPGGSGQWFAQEGLIQVSFDNRASGHFGKKGLNYIYRQLGKYEIEDYMTCARWLREKKWIDTNKVAITGGSFGGYMTCMALTYGADVFNYGIANSSVTDWHLYDTHYTERYMDKPSDNPEGYKKTSVMTYANRYKGLLRIIHGTSDDNVHMQNSLQLIDVLENQNKHFEFMLYPGERHGIGGNERAKGIHNRAETYNFLYRYLLGKPMPEAFWESPSSSRRGF